MLDQDVSFIIILCELVTQYTLHCAVRDQQGRAQWSKDGFVLGEIVVVV